MYSLLNYDLWVKDKNVFCESSQLTHFSKAWTFTEKSREVQKFPSNTVFKHMAIHLKDFSNAEFVEESQEKMKNELAAAVENGFKIKGDLDVAMSKVEFLEKEKQEAIKTYEEKIALVTATTVF